ncbi:MAG TPA: 2,3-bisphosphoglycerate-independent phosphoglycerate mutase [Chitinophagales bacterium]|nr:2,3-bisphosphoglycerate-independent phosphoglycerate mutase [Chitinophagales bacterium]HNE45671.1 2,3-bisphosphoglycerate-independent phosphoglycerate mutase [Chitinophagales bacterium]HNM07804.1 2,3-bisphosphoglycerate-independent phosphoglycerate mutase [Chitinophagales bacterium]
MKSMKKVMLIIMDGWGHGQNAAASAIAQANTPNVNAYYKRYPNAELRTDGEFVGLPEGQMGNSEVGHLNLGAGRIVYQELQRIHMAIRNGELASNNTLLSALDFAKNNGKKVHFIGLVSDGGVHSHSNHLMALCDIAKSKGLTSDQVFIHAFTDGRDCDPKSGVGFIRTLQQHLTNSAGTIASVCGRYYAMDRDKRWERIKKAYDLLVHGEGNATQDVIKSIEQSYSDNVTDEFILPIICTDAQQKPLATIAAGDVVICFNFRTDRCRQITRALTQEAFPEFDMTPIDLHYVTMTRYDHTFKNVGVIFESDDLSKTLGEILEANNKTQIRIAETEKYPHVTFFFSGGREKEFSGERRIMIASPKVATYDLQPEMSAYLVKDAIVEAINNESPDFICLNFANADMVGHTGVFSAAIKACEAVDTCVGEVIEAALSKNYAVILTADHGNSDVEINEDGTPNTQHSTNPVPVFYIDKEPAFQQIRNGKLGDIAPTILTLMGIDIPKEMTGEILVS